MIGGWPETFDALAPDYDEHARRKGWRVNHLVVELLAPFALRPDRVLDLGAGTGQTTEELARLFPEASFTLVDRSRGMGEIARDKLPGATVIDADAADFLRSTRDTWNLVAAIGCLELMPEMFEVLRLAASRLVPGGLLVVTHEPLTGTSVQAQPRSYLSGGRVVLRHAREEVERRAASYGLVRVAHQDLVAFQRGESGEDVVYELVVWSAR